MTLLEKFRRVSTSEPCPICERPDWCLVARDGAIALCQRMESSVRWAEAGWLHRLREGDRVQSMGRSWTISPADHVGLEQLTTAFEHRAAEQAVLPRLATSLGVETRSLSRLRVGWDGLAFTFPMHDLEGRVVGIRRRLSDGRKLSVKGGQDGLFLARELPTDTAELWIAEGPTDTAALLDMSFPAVGRPSCRGGTRLLSQLVRANRVRNVVVVSDQDEPGRLGAAALAYALAPQCTDVRVVHPPVGVKDARDWKSKGATRGEVGAAARMAPPTIIHLELRRGQP